MRFHPPSIRQAARTAACIAKAATQQVRPVDVTPLAKKHDLYPCLETVSDLEIERKSALLKDIDERLFIGRPAHPESASKPDR